CQPTRLEAFAKDTGLASIASCQPTRLEALAKDTGLCVITDAEAAPLDTSIVQANLVSLAGDEAASLSTSCVIANLIGLADDIAAPRLTCAVLAKFVILADNETAQGLQNTLEEVVACLISSANSKSAVLVTLVGYTSLGGQTDVIAARCLARVAHADLIVLANCRATSWLAF
ncbi:hypothetical protein THAR02_03828, partial [Trichoderma harzianum]